MLDTLLRLRHSMDLNNLHLYCFGEWIDEDGEDDIQWQSQKQSTERSQES